MDLQIEMDLSPVSSTFCIIIIIISPSQSTAGHAPPITRQLARFSASRIQLLPSRHSVLVKIKRERLVKTYVMYRQQHVTRYKTVIFLQSIH
jgi:hypothetical protein